MGEHTITGILEKVKQDERNIIYEIKTDCPGLKGSLYIDRSRLPIFDRLVLTKEGISDEP